MTKNIYNEVERIVNTSRKVVRYMATVVRSLDLLMETKMAIHDIAVLPASL